MNAMVSAASATLHDARWPRVAGRDRSARDAFVYSVASTGIYCRPGCASRTPRPDNVAFHDTAEAAESLGFRPCKRCKPADAEKTDAIGADAARAPAAVGSLRYTSGRCALGWVLVACTPRGIAVILLGDDVATLERELASRFPRAHREPAGDALADVLALTLACVDARADVFDAALDPHGTPFRRRVWSALRDVPAGTTVSYADIARAIGRPTSARAVAQACAANPLAVAVPCHRIVRADGSLSGYRWGVERKRALLAREAQA